jgi:hypothetical protein
MFPFTFAPKKCLRRVCCTGESSMDIAPSSGTTVPFEPFQFCPVAFGYMLVLSVTMLHAHDCR